jgi:hypothetical protein
VPNKYSVQTQDFSKSISLIYQRGSFLTLADKTGRLYNCQISTVRSKRQGCLLPGDKGRGICLQTGESRKNQDNYQRER